jgi:hypothetical protein
MQRYTLLAGVSFVLSLIFLPSAPAFAITAKQKMETCKFGADHPMLAGKARAEFLKKCMADKNDPRGATPGAAARPGGAAPEGDPD